MLISHQINKQYVTQATTINSAIKIGSIKHLNICRYFVLILHIWFVYCSYILYMVHNWCTCTWCVTRGHPQQCPTLGMLKVFHHHRKCSMLKDKMVQNNNPKLSLLPFIRCPHMRCNTTSVQKYWCIWYTI